MFEWPPYFVINVSKISRMLFSSLFLPLFLWFSLVDHFEAALHHHQIAYFWGGGLSSNDPYSVVTASELQKQYDIY